MAGVAGSLQGGIGQWRHRVSILRKSAGENDLGQKTGDYEAIASSVPARVIELSGRELERAKQLIAEATHSIALRCSSTAVTPQDRIQHGNKILAVASVVTDETGMIQNLVGYEVKR
jgi:SPP1 family predicted phage head-tail adaptor